MILSKKYDFFFYIHKSCDFYPPDNLIAFAYQVYDIDHKNSAECVKRIDKLLKEFEKSVAKEGT